MEKMSPVQLEKLKRMLDGRKENSWYNSAAWEATRQKMLRLDRYECQICKEKASTEGLRSCITSSISKTDQTLR